MFAGKWSIVSCCSSQIRLSFAKSFGSSDRDSMTTRELIMMAGMYPWHVLGAFVAVPFLAGLLGLILGVQRAKQSPWRYLYSILVHLACVPGMAAAVLTGYAVLFTRQNLLDVNLLIYLLPIMSMAATLLFIRRNVSFDDIPGFDRLSGLMVMIAITFMLVLALERTRIWLVFGASIYTVFALVIVCYGLLKWGAYMLFRRKDESRIEPPSFGLR